MKKLIVIISICVILISCLLLVYLIYAEGFSVIRPLRSDEPYRIYTDEQIPRRELSLFLVTEEQIILYFDYEGIINAYSQEGTFLYGLQVKSLKNGIGDIAFNEGLLYIKARGGTIYIFEGTTLVSSFSRADNAIAYIEAGSLMEGDPCHQMNGTTYYVSNNKILKSVNNGALQTVVSLPERNPDVGYLAIFILLAIAGLMHYLHISKSSSFQ